MRGGSSAIYKSICSYSAHFLYFARFVYFVRKIYFENPDCTQVVIFKICFAISDILVLLCEYQTLFLSEHQLQSLVFWHKFKDKIFQGEWDLVKIVSILAKRPPCKKRWLTLLNMQLAIDVRVQRSIIRECIYVSDKISIKMCFKLKTYKASGKRKKIMKIKHFIMKSKWGREVLNFIFYKEDMGDFKMKIFLFYISYYTILYST